MRDDSSIDLGAKVATSPQRNAGLSIPLAVDYRIDQLLQRMINYGERTSRKELVAAILASSDDDDEAISRILRWYRRALAEDVLLQDDAVGTAASGSKVVSLPDRRPGPRRLTQDTSDG